MTTDIQKLHDVWFLNKNKARENTELSEISFDDLTNSVMNTGPFYFYVIDFYDMSLSNVSPAIYDMHGFNPETVAFKDVIETIHPDDVAFVAKAEGSIANLFYENLGGEKMLKYKTNYSFRSRMKNGEYALLNHQALMLTLDTNGGYGKSIKHSYPN